MKKTIKMVLYAEPGTGKSVFALGFPKPFFITTDGNYSWLEAFGAKERDHLQVHSWEEAKKAFNSFSLFDNYETIVIDLIEDLFKWCELEFCEKNKITHISDFGYGKGYDITRNEFINEMIKLIGKENKNVILLSHSITTVEKNSRGVEKTIYSPSNRIPDKVWGQLEGRVQFFNRAYLVEEVKKDEETGQDYTVNKRILSLIKKPEERYSIIRNINENSVPRDISLDYKTFIDVIESHLINRKVNVNNVDDMEDGRLEDGPSKTKEEEKLKVVKEEVKKVEKTKEDLKSVSVEKPKIESSDPKIAAMKAKLAALKAKKNNQK